MKKIAVITGASSGMGKKYVEILCKRKVAFDEIWLIARRQNEMERLAKKFPQYSFKIFPLDLSTSESYLKYEETLKEEKPRIKLLINNAGFGKTKDFASSKREDVLGMIDLNVRALTALSHISIPYMGKGSKMIQMASVAGFMPQPYFSIYAATKAYVISFSRALRREVKKKGISVITVCPGPVKTEFFEIAGSVNVIKKAFFKDADTVVKKALSDLNNNKELSLCGYPMQALRILEKILPHSFLMNFIKE